tara:strand:+ start:622 stop:1551 length:930 start_codon:yes stop_codon:yes gene_type:complete
MATTTTVSSNYAGKVAGSIIGKAFKEADTLRLGFVTVAENVNYKMNLRKIQYTDGTTDYTCGFVPEGAVVLSEKVIDPKKVMNSFQICKEDFRQTWSEDSEGASASNPNMASDIMEAIMLEVLSSQAQKVDDEIWNGVNATDGEIGDGFIAQFTADGAVIKVGNGITSVATATTEANVEAHLKTALNAIPRALRRKNVQIGVSADVFQNYSFYLISKGIANDGNADSKMAKFGKYNLIELGGLEDNTIICAEAKNLIFATGLKSDHNELATVDEDEIGLLTGQVRGKMVYNGGMGYYNSEEIVWFLTTA